MKRENLEKRPYCTIIASSDFPFYAANEADSVMDGYEARIKELEAENERLKAKTENIDERREYAYEMDIVIRWLDKNEDFVTEPNGKMQLLKSKAMHQKIKWIDEHPRTPTTEDKL